MLIDVPSVTRWAAACLTLEFYHVQRLAKQKKVYQQVSRTLEPEEKRILDELIKLVKSDANTEDVGLF